MLPTHANKKGVRYRYYVSQSLIKRDRPVSEAACRVPVADLEALVETRIRALLKDQTALLSNSHSLSIATRKALIENAAALAHRWPTLPAARKCAAIHALVTRIDLRPTCVGIAVCPAMVMQIVNSDPDLQQLPSRATGPVEVLTIAARVRRTGMETRLVIDNAQPTRRPDRSLLRLLGQAHRFQAMVAQNQSLSVADLAAAAGVTRSYFTRVFRLSFLSPQITTAILEGRQSPELTATKLKQASSLSPSWSEQLRQLGFR